MSKKVYVFNLSQHTGTKDLDELFSKVGKVNSPPQMFYNPGPPGIYYGIVEMSTEEEEAQAAIRDLEYRELKGSVVNVQSGRKSESEASNLRAAA